MKIKPLLVCAVYGLWLAAGSVFLAVALYYLSQFAIEPLSRDQWHMYAQLFDEGLLKTSLSTVSGHRHLFAFSLFWLDWRFFDASNQLLLGMAWLLNAALLGLLIKQVWQRAPARLLLAGTVLLLGSWLINLALLGWGFNGVNNYLSIVPSVYALHWLAQAAESARATAQARRYLLLAAIAGLVACVSFGNGAVVWPAGFFLLWGLRANHKIFIGWAAAAALGLSLYFLLPGADAVNGSLLFNGWYTLRYPFEQLGGPLWHLLRSVPRLESPAWMLVAKTSGYGIGLLSLAYLSWMLLGRRLQVAPLAGISCALQLIGWGTLLLLTITRPAGMLDITIDRFQIWALLIWLGLLLGLWVFTGFRRLLVPLALLFPLAALPSQLDWGARLAEYNNRTTQGLLSWMMELQVTQDAERALHWNWQQKLEPLQYVLTKAQAEHKNLYRKLPPQPLAAAVPALAACDAAAARLRRLPILASELVGADQKTNDMGAVVGWRVFAEYPWTAEQTMALLNADRQISGFALPIVHSRLPRPSGVRVSGYNVYAVAKSSEPPVWLVIYAASEPVCELRLTDAD